MSVSLFGLNSASASSDRLWINSFNFQLFFFKDSLPCWFRAMLVGRNIMQNFALQAEPGSGFQALG